MILLDTDVVIDLGRGHAPALSWLGLVRNETVILPGFVVMELLQGCRNKTEQDKLQKQISRFQIAWPSSTFCDAALATYSQLRLSHNLGLLDALIAFTAIELNTPLHTFNQKHYEAISALNTVEPYAR